MPFSDMTKFT